MRRTRAPRGVVAAIAGLLLAGLTSAPAARAADPDVDPTVEATMVDVPGHTATGPIDLAMAPDGSAVVVWVTRDWPAQAVVAVSRSADGAWGPPEVLSDPTRDADMPEVAVDAAGEFTVVWSLPSGSTSIVQGVTRAPGETWGPVSVLGSSTTTYPAPRAVVSATHDDVVVWYDGSGVHAATRPPNGVWQSDVVVSGALGGARPALAANDAGIATVAWRTNAGGVGMTTLEAGAWTQAEQLSGTDPVIGAPKVAVGPDGRSTALWTSAPHNPDPGAFDRDHTVYTSRREAGGSWTPSLALSGAMTDFGPPTLDLAVSGTGEVTAMWLDDSVYPYRLWTVTRPPDRPWQPPTEVATTASVFLASLSADPHGNTTILAAARVSGVVRLHAWHRPAGQDWTSPRSLSEPISGLGWYVIPASRPGGETLVAWSPSLPRLHRSAVYVTSMDFTAPELHPVEVPTTASVGIPVRFAVTSDEPVSTGRITWDLGDGTTTSGASVDHAFAAPGTYEVAVRVADRAGNTTSRRYVVTVTGPREGPTTGSTTDPTPVPTTVPEPSTGRTFHVEADKRRLVVRGGKGAELEIALTEPARVRFAIVHHDARRKSRTRRPMPRVAFVREFEAGTHPVKITATMGEHGLRPGAYTLLVKAISLPGRPAYEQRLVVRR